MYYYIYVFKVLEKTFFIRTLKHAIYKQNENDFIYLFICFEKQWGRDRERKRERKFQSGSALSAQNPTWGSHPGTVRL